MASGSSLDANDWPVVGVTQKTLEGYKKGGAALLITKDRLSADSIALGLRPIPVEDWPDLIKRLGSAYQDAGLVMSAATKG
jgi:hypothetical protein